jgi:hypothetical protein
MELNLKEEKLLKNFDDIKRQEYQKMEKNI